MSAVDQKRFKALGQDWVARFDFNSICEIEDRTGRPFLSVVSPFLNTAELEEIKDEEKMAQALAKLRMSDFRMILHQALLSEQPETTPQKAGEIIASKGLTEIAPVIIWAIQRGLPQSSEDGKEGN